MEGTYYNPKDPGSYGGVEPLRRATKKPKKKVKEFLQRQRTYQLHKPRRVRFVRRKYQVSDIDDLWQADLADMTRLKDENDGYAYLLVMIDVFSKMLWVRALANKTADTTLDAMQDIIEKEGRRPANLMTDKGTEFVNARAQEYFTNIHVNFYTSQNPETKASVAERVIRTLKGRLYKMMTKQGNKRYIDKLQEVVNAYNNSVHRTIGMRPVDVNEDTDSYVRARLLPLQFPANIPKFKFKSGQRVRLAILRTQFTKGYKPQWTEEVFMVWRRQKTIPPTYKLKDLEGERITGSFYEPELQHVPPGTDLPASDMDRDSPELGPAAPPPSPQPSDRSASPEL